MNHLATGAIQWTRGIPVWRTPSFGVPPPIYGRLSKIMRDRRRLQRYLILGSKKWPDQAKVVVDRIGENKTEPPSTETLLRFRPLVISPVGAMVRPLRRNVLTSSPHACKTCTRPTPHPFPPYSCPFPWCAIEGPQGMLAQALTIGDSWWKV